MRKTFRFGPAWLAALIAVAITTTTSRAALMDYEPFAYSGTALNGQSGGTGWTGAWFTTGATDNLLSNDGVSLAYPTSFESPLVTPSTSGSHVQTGGLTANANTSRMLSQTINLSQDGNVRYVSALFRKNVANGGTPNVTADNILLEFVDSAGNRRWGVGIEGTTDKPWLNANGSTTPSAGSAVVVGDTYFMVAKIVSSASSPDTAYLKVFGTGYGTQVPFAEPVTWDATLTTSTGANLDRIRVRIDNAATGQTPGEVDEIRIGGTWGAVVGVPEPSSLSLVGLTGLAGLVHRRRRTGK
jgi:hypothetical protein